MRVLVTAASKYGATEEIARVVADTIADAGHEVTVVPAGEVSDVEAHDAFVVGSAVYAGHWMSAARELIAEHGDVLRGKPVWLFSSGPVGEPPKPEQEPVDVTSMLELSGARAHQVFSGKLDRSKLRFADKAIVVAMRAPEGDFRDWDEIRTWADEIARALSGGAGE